MKGLLPAELHESISAGKRSGRVFVVADPYIAQVLRAETGYENFTDIYTWAVSQLGHRKPNPIDLLRVYESSLKALSLETKGSLPELWEAAQRLGRDWEEVLRGTSSIQQAQTYWKALSDHRLIQATFRLFQSEEAPSWLRILPFPHKNPSHTAKFWRDFSAFIQTYRDTLQSRGLIFSEEALHRLKERSFQWEGVIFLHLYSTYTAIRELLRIASTRGAEVWGWDLSPLHKFLPELWDAEDSPSRAFSFENCVRVVHFHFYPTLLEVVEGAAERLYELLSSDPEARIAVWCEGETAALLRFLLKHRYHLGEKVSPAPPSLLEHTRIGQVLQTHLIRGLRGEVSEWPAIEAQEEASESPSETWAKLLYETVQRHSSPTSEDAWRFLLKLLQSEAPHEVSFSGQERLYIGRLSQLAGGRYDALFMVEPPSDPLGKWNRPSFWIPSLRRQFSSPAEHERIAWRLMVILLWGSRQVYLYRRSHPEFASPIEEFLRYGRLFEMQAHFEEPRCVFSDTTSSTPSKPLSPQKPLDLSQELSPAWLSQILVCPRRAYWEKVLRKRPPNQAAQLGQLLHRLISEALRGIKKRPLPNTPRIHRRSLRLRQLGYALSRRRLYYRIAALYKKEGLWHKRHHLLRPFMAEVGQPLLHTLIDLLGLNGSDSKNLPSPRPLYWKHLRLYPNLRLNLKKVEEDIQSPDFMLIGRLDLLVEATLPPSPDNPQGRTLSLLIDFKPSVRKDPTKFQKFLSCIEEGLQRLGPFQSYTPPEGYREELFQLFLYVWLLKQTNQTLDHAALVSLWWRPSKQADLNGKPPHEAYNPDDIESQRELLATCVQKLRDYFLHSSGSEHFPMTNLLSVCRSCDFALLCNRLS
ncbi:MAG: PD-(D/E)XK nuclease family protein [Bacteroidia bacterium]|nr:PD-(D/E)XK nuclease family protein [Bacteroidia bacterium]